MVKAVFCHGARPMRIPAMFLRHPALRVLASLAAVALVVMLAAAGFVIGVATLVVLAAIAGWRRWRQRRASAATIIEGEFAVIPRRRTALPRAD
jgi:hypothetical protein